MSERKWVWQVIHEMYADTLSDECEKRSDAIEQAIDRYANTNGKLLQWSTIRKKGYKCMQMLSTENED